ncbi:MAG: ABC transporter ATP-binding protein [Anaerocolumna aminovalerica]|jgi:ATP-binding cassette subfamily B multidrug efflux pump|uniref:ABC transporter ATP-binding protein n=1 Tax=Anaerocolumna aminovalerica TaxID=1527 RepID=UPI001C0EE753|nr:ABC transporter ATP-binding protein [Anaerocolumna aminovalerica]MBU5334480.1 ABC transporter ATP-binding protein/permease [Anaerocolumna aminovalerica]MDU6264740.1 ABC transporter ATP-binding protein [Anaerocolumna aminovalerica]
MSINATRDDEASVSSKGKLATLLRLFKYLLVYKKEIAIVLFIMGCIVAITLINPLIIERAIDVHIANKDMNGLIKLGVFAVIMNIIFVCMVKLRIYIMSRISNNVLLTIRQELYEHIQKLSFSFFDSRPTGKILARIIGDVNSLKDVLSNSVTTLIPDFISICGVVTIMLVKNYKLALASLISLPLLIIAMWFIQVYSHVRWQIHRKKSSNLNAFIHEDLSGMRIIQSFTAEKETEEDFDQLLKEHRGSFIDAILLNDAFGSAIDICWGLGTVCLYYVGVKMIGRESVPIGTLLAFGSYISMFWRPIMNLSNFYNQLVTNISGAERIFEILDTKPDISDKEKVTDIPEIKGDIVFSHVSFAYDKDTKVLNDVNFHIKPGETIALVGPTGAGKTTIVNLISRFYDIQEGDIIIDGYNVKDVTIESLRMQMGVMTQDNFLFSGTVKDNIRYGKLDATDEEVIAAAKAVHAHEFIMKLEKGYETELKERGSGLSIGQRQLLAFARTMVSMPKILILDEATSSIDTHTEILVQQGIEALLKGRTSFVIAHRLSTIQKADRIFVIDDGGIKEEGSAQELLEKKGMYYELYMAQFKNI